jgi:cob(I)alamin adenosyltransferase
MGNRLSKIYTRTGDDGTTGLGDGSRTPKDSVRVEAYGTVDEANSAIGVVLASDTVPPDVRTCLTEIQHDLFELGGELCIPGHSAVRDEFIDRLERDLDAFNEDHRAPRRATGFHAVADRRCPVRGNQVSESLV